MKLLSNSNPIGPIVFWMIYQVLFVVKGDNALMEFILKPPFFTTLANTIDFRISMDEPICLLYEFVNEKLRSRSSEFSPKKIKQLGCCKVLLH